MRLLRRLSNISPARLAEWAKNPSMYEVMLRGPRVSTVSQALQVLFPDKTEEEFQSTRLELLSNHEFYSAVNKVSVEARHRHVRWADWTEFMYVAVRLARPDVMIETGVFAGQSTAVTLQAMADSGHGKLISIDLPATGSIEGSTDRQPDPVLSRGRRPGWLVPDHLRDRHQLELGDARELLPGLLESVGSVDIFFHDSLHTYDHMMWEFQAAWPYLREGGLLLSDDIQWNASFYRFCKQHGRDYLNVGGGFGAARK
jgi:predicted O-methyltransferase YrrM